MVSREFKTRSLIAIAAASLFLAPAIAQAEIYASSAAPHAVTMIERVSEGCGHNYFRAPNGSCDIVRSPNLDCPDGFHAVPAPTPSGYRCVQDGY